MATFNETITDTLVVSGTAGGTFASGPPQPRPIGYARWASNLVYLLKSNAPQMVDWYKMTLHGVNLETGQKITELKKVRVKKAVVLPMSFERKCWLLRQIPELTGKGLIEMRAVTVVIDRKDTKLKWEPPTTEDWFVFDNARWDVLEGTNYGNRVYSITLLETVGQQMVRIEETHNGLILEDDPAGVL